MAFEEITRQCGSLFFHSKLEIRLNVIFFDPIPDPKLIGKIIHFIKQGIEAIKSDNPNPNPNPELKIIFRLKSQFELDIIFLPYSQFDLKTIFGPKS